MLIELKNSILSVDGVAAVKDVVINLQPKLRKLRTTFIYAGSDSSENPIDLYISNYSNIGFDKYGIHFTLQGMELNRSISFNIKIGIHPYKKSMFLNGNIGNQEIQRVFSQPLELIKAVVEIIKTQNKTHQIQGGN